MLCTRTLDLFNKRLQLSTRLDLSPVRIKVWTRSISLALIRHKVLPIIYTETRPTPHRASSCPPRTAPAPQRHQRKIDLPSIQKHRSVPPSLARDQEFQDDPTSRYRTQRRDRCFCIVAPNQLSSIWRLVLHQRVRAG